MTETPHTHPSVKHAEPQPTTGPASGNPVGKSLNLVVSVPEEITIRMVDASALSDYEMWVFLASILSNAVVGFIVATVQAFDSSAANRTQLLWTAIAFGVLFLATAGRALGKRCGLTRGGKNIRLKASEATAD